MVNTSSAQIFDRTFRGRVHFRNGEASQRRSRLRATVIGVKPGLHPDTLTFVLTADRSFDTGTGSWPALSDLRTFGLPVMPPNPFGPT
jgi:hypothetical protein